MGQNKNNFVLKYLVALAYTDHFKEINYNFFIKGHTKNSCDRGFSVIRRKIVKSTLYTMRQRHDAVMEASVSSKRVLMEEEPVPFRDFEKSLDELYSNVKGIQSTSYSRCGTISSDQSSALRYPTQSPTCSTSGASMTAQSPQRRELCACWTQRRRYLIPVNPEKVSDIYKKVTKYVPTEHRGDLLYQPPTAEQEE